MMTAQLDEARVKEQAEKFQQVIEVMGQRLVGQEHVSQRLLMGLVLQGHVLLEGLPGLAKTTAVRALGDTSDLSVKRIQFTPDLLPADVIGTQIYEPKSGQFEVKKGPIFANLLIADEINRAPAKVQSALLEAMQELQVTLGDHSFALDQPFLVMATQNPIEQEGTYSLPEAQVDRFLFKLKVGYASRADEKQIMQRMASGQLLRLEKTLSKEDILSARNLIEQIYVSDKIRDYIVDLVFSTRYPIDSGLRDLANLIQVGASPRASINLERASRAAAVFAGRTYVTPDDVKSVGMDILRHRILLSYEAEADNITSDDIVNRLFERVDVP